MTVFNVEVTLYDSDNNILTVENEESQMLVAPFYLESKASGYVSLNLDYNDNYEDLNKVEIKYEELELQEDIYSLTVSKVNTLKEDGFFIDEDEEFESEPSDAIKVLFNIENEHDVEVSYVLGVGFYNDKEELIGSSVPVNYIDVDYELSPGESKNVDFLEFLPLEHDDIEEVKINAIGIPFETE